jgi:hypothetical protein
MLPAAEAEYARAADANPDDPEPSVRLARLLRDRLQRPSEAAVWFRRALTVPAMPDATQWAILREYVELQERVLRQPAAALPVLTRAREQYGGTSLSDWAAAEIRRIRETRSSRDA